MELTLSPADYERVRKKYPDAAPILLHKSKGADNTVPLLPKNKFLVKKSYTIGQFLYVVRHTLKLPPEKALFLFIQNTLPTSSMTIGEAWNTYKSEDNALHMYYAAENTFGCVA